MDPISNSSRLIIWIVTGFATVIFAILAIVLEANLVFIVRKLFPQLREKGGRPPSKKPFGVWILFLLSIFLIIIGTAIASSAPDVNAVSLTPDSFPDARAVDISALFANPNIVPDLKRTAYVNLDGFGPEEIIVTSYKDDTPPFSINIELFVYDSDDKSWRKILNVANDGGCDIHFDFLNLNKDESRQLLIYQSCGNASHIHLQVYQYRGLRFAELLYKTQEPILNAVVSVVNSELFVTSYMHNVFYHLSSNGSVVSMENLKLNLPSNYYEVHHWRDGDTIIFSDDLQNVQVGDYILFIHDREKDTEICFNDMRVDPEHLTYTEYPNLIATIKRGDTSVSLRCKFESAVGSFDFKIK